ncbi:S66 peptidase family protein [Bacillus inaquosorum]|uniref:S66 peptidase family protein n=1 Tax=Bacillus inaquosorum TaxID=483913 RepID=UPI0022831A9F|nr:LD-carboxypeptidase [Bacillus inaquosorum]MCY8797700.1 LD-carboxypeptidase [Bacillus inaquosorum]MEC0769119.1 LD-carboxypeptidase [Bacillus inaquosorum]MEC0794919.1 LD-carboxypeptidase [Bacillus inaquosorum]
MKGVIQLNHKPKALKKGDTVGVIAPASPPDPKKLETALLFLEELGLQVKLGKALKNQHGYLAGQDDERLADLHEMFRDEEVNAVLCACGGFGTGRIAAGIDFSLIRKHPKIFWGYSDITFLHTAIYQNTGLVTFHGPMLSSDIGLDDVHPLTKASYEQLFQETAFTYTEELSPLTVLVPGKAEGELVGGNLSLLASALGTPFEIDTRGKLLFIEDIDEEPYQIDRMLNQLKMAGKLTNAAGILVCDFHNCVPVKREKSLSLEQVLEDYIVSAGKPALRGFKIGHCSPSFAVPIGAQAAMNTAQKTVVIEAGVSEGALKK